MIICLCGKSGSGKTYIAKKLKDDNTIVIDVDKIGHMSIKNKIIKKKLIDKFGNEILSNDEINRKKLSKIVFSNKEKMRALEDITWEYMKNKINNIINRNINKKIIIDWALLPKTELFDLCDLKILIDVPFELRKDRVLKRDNISVNDFKLRDSSSITYDKSKFDFVSDGQDINLIIKKIKGIE